MHPGPSPPNLLSKQWSLVFPVVFDGVPLFKSFGDVKADASKGSYTVVGSLLLASS